MGEGYLRKPVPIRDRNGFKYSKNQSKKGGEEVSSEMRIFLAAPLFSEAERRFNDTVADTLRKEGFDVWMAQEAPFIEEGTSEEKKRIFKGDMDALRSSDVVVAILDGPHVEEGVAFELGVAHALGKKILGLKTDYRSFSATEGVNLLLEVPMMALHSSLEKLSKELHS